jgi:hypothetical protein
MMKSIAFLCAVLGACTNNTVDSDEQARRAYLGLDKSISKSLDLGFEGYDAATSANISQQTGSGDAGGTLAINGKVDQGTQSQATMTLEVGMTSYSDGKFVVDDKGDTISVTYDTSTDVTTQPALNLKLNASAGNTLGGSLTGEYTMRGDLTGTVTLDVTISGTFTGSGTSVERVAGSTTVTGTATNSSGGMYAIDVML